MRIMSKLLHMGSFFMVLYYLQWQGFSLCVYIYFNILNILLVIPVNAVVLFCRYNPSYEP